MFEYLIFAAISILGVQSQVPSAGLCPKIDSVQPNFDVKRYLGKWYEQEKYFAVFELDGRCISATYSLNEDGTVKVLNKQIDKSTNKPRSIVGSATPVGDDGAKLVVNFDIIPIRIDAPYWILETDYDNYAVVWSCTNLGIVNTKWAWILTRDRNPPGEVLEKAHAVFDRYGLSTKHLLKTDQQNCPEDV